MNDTCLRKNSSYIDKTYNNNKPPEYYLYVEGKTDRDFFLKFPDKKFECIIAKNGHSNNRRENVIDSLTRNSNIKYYALIDRDFDSPEPMFFDKEKRIFYTDTHDLETLQLYLFKAVIFNIHEIDESFSDEEKEVLQNNLDNAKYIAYQIGVIKKALYEMRKANKGTSYIPNDIPLNYRDFTKENKTVLRWFYNNYAKKGKGLAITAKALSNEKTIMEYYSRDESNELVFFKNKDEILKSKDFWYVVNGHDILELLRSMNKKIDEILRNYDDFESALIVAFKNRFFKSANLFCQMTLKNLFSMLNLNH